MNTNNFSVGVDIESVIKFRNLNKVKSKKFLSKIFTKKEVDYCFSKQHPDQHLAARFVGKEAVIKALKSVGIKGQLIQLGNIEITNNAEGVPSVTFRYEENAKDKNIIDNAKIVVSLSHCEDKAMAVALIAFGVANRKI